MKRKIHENLLQIALISILTLILFNSCDTQSKSQSSGKYSIFIDGSSTVYPITESISELFMKSNSNISIDIKVSGTSGGFSKFIEKSVSITNASRKINEQEKLSCQENDIQYLEFKVAYDGIAIVTNINNNWLNDLTIAELKTIWEDNDSMEWSDIRHEWGGEEFVLFAPGENSGTFDYFKEVLLNKGENIKSNIKQSENDNLLVKGITNEKNGLGFFGLAYFENNKDKLKLIAIDNGNGAVLPTTTTVSNGTYSPLSRPLFLYVNTELLNTPEGKKYIDFYLSNLVKAASSVGYVPLSQSELNEERKKLALQ